MNEGIVLTNDQSSNAEDIFLDAIDRPAADRDAYLLERCGENRDLLQQVRKLIAADEAAQEDDFLRSKFMPASPRIQAFGDDQEDATDDIPEEYASVNESARFRILSRHDEGGLGEVLVAHDRQLDREVAIKQIRPQWNGHKEANARFLREAEITGRLEHPGIVPVYAMGTWKDGRPFYAMRFIEGQTLRQVIREHRDSLQDEPAPASAGDGGEQARSLRTILNRFVDVCNTIEYAHSRRIIHRDIKPANIMIGPYGETLVVDWGLAKQLEEGAGDALVDGEIDRSDESAVRSDSSHTRAGGAVGTPQYMSPEQAGGDVQLVGCQTDVYLLGATLYQILTGSPPHQDDSVSQILQRVRQEEVTPPRRRDANVPEPLQAICLKAMARKTTDRYPTAAALAADVERWLGDESVSVFNDPLPVRIGRWGRKHRTLATSGAVAALLLMFGSIVGAAFWSYQSSQRLKVERERNQKELQLTIANERRLNEIHNSVDSDWQIAASEIEFGRYESALGILQRAFKTLEEEPEFSLDRERIVAKAERMQRLVSFYDLAEQAEEFGIMSRDTQGIMAASNAVKALGVWEQRDWWNYLPNEDLSANQRDQLLWDTYQQWIILDGMLVKTIGTRLFGVMKHSDGQSDSGERLWKAWMAMQTKAGIAEAQAAKVVSERVELFRQSEAVRWYRGIANFRLGDGKWVKGEELGTARNAADAQKIGIMCLLSAMDPSFRVVFKNYKNLDAVEGGRQLFQRSASLRPNHYWTQLTLGHLQYFSAIQQPELDWQSYSLAIQTFGRCIAINPDNCFGYADRAALYRMQADLLQEDQSVEPSIRDERIEDLLLWSMQDAENAFRLGEKQPWVGWVYGMTLSAIDQNQLAVDVLLETCRQSLALVPVVDSALIAAEDLRGRSDAIQFAEEMMLLHPEQPVYRVLLASVHLTRQQNDVAEGVLNELFESGQADGLSPPLLAHALAARGILHLSAERLKLASEDFTKANQLDPHHLWAAYGIAACKDLSGAYEEALGLYKLASKLAILSEHQAACLLGIGRTQAFLGKYPEAAKSVRGALETQPGCEVIGAVRPLYDRLKAWAKTSKPKEEMRQLSDWIKEINQLPRATKVLIADGETPGPYRASLLNGGFERGGWNYWSNDRGIAWINDSGYRSLASVTSSQAHTGEYSMRIVGDRPPAGETPTIGGRTKQVFPIPENSRCVISVWAKARDLNEGAVRLIVDGSQIPVTLDVAEGTYDWRKFETEIYFGRSPDPTLTSIPMEVQILSAGEGEAWLDDLAVTVFDTD
ncbi:Serine/threonine-protein kinase PknB [Rhodopirellula islandica]|uniref:Serine/threonine-protein kinase PknB n=1 Tax=Rhodopirellula islandica TaxID=595434 RepID=A0A0J1B490_RHOIS|nr:serine/threonine-protein kinase [Rhodopirellula islandica]KLU01675.1 Serine/threonine-protein kinase PknB [Rhodopirellula islandica]